MTLLLIGSSILKNWRLLSKIYKNNNILINNAVGGSTTEYQLLNFNKLIIPYNPSIIIWYCGSNDINNNINIYTIILNTIKWLNKVILLYPHCKILLLSIIKSPQKLIDGHINTINFINDFLENVIRNYFIKYNISFIDINTYLFDNTNKVIIDFYKKDNLHLKNSAYKILTPCIVRYISNISNH